jgi:thioredoxin reductase (NADPH)
MSAPAPVLMAVDDDPAALARIEGELTRRYADDYRIVCVDSAEAARTRLEALRDAEDEVALLLTEQWMPVESGSSLLAYVKDLYPHAKRALLIDWGAWADPATATAILRAMALGHSDYYVLKPWHRRDEHFHRTITEFLHEWSREYPSQEHEIVLIADPGSPRAHTIRDLLRRSGVPHGFHPHGSAPARAMLQGTSGESVTAPLIRLYDERVLVDPSDEEIAEALGVETEPGGDPDFDVVIIGAGPAGLSAAVYASSEGLRTLVLERDAVGGQAGSSSLIRNYLGFSRGVTGGELAQRAYQQAWTFGARFVVTREATTLGLDAQPPSVSCDAGYTATGRAIVLATGVTYRRLGIRTLDRLTGAGVFYGAATAEAQALAGEHVFVVGGGNSAGQAALHLARWARTVTVLVRRGSLADDMSQYLREAIDAAPNVDVLARVEIEDGGGEGRLEWLQVRNRETGESTRFQAAALFVLIGARPHTDWLPERISRDRAGYVLTGADVLADPDAERTWPLERPPRMFETSAPGVFAVGDVRHGSVKRVASAVGEGGVVIRQIYEHLAEGGLGPDMSVIAAGQRA